MHMAPDDFDVPHRVTSRTKMMHAYCERRQMSRPGFEPTRIEGLDSGKVFT